MKNKKVYILLAVLVIFCGISIIELKKPFRFAHMEYIQDINDFNADPTELLNKYDLELKIPLSQVENEQILNFIDRFKDSTCIDSEFICDIKQITIAAQYLQSLSSGEILRERFDDFISEDIRFKKICSESSKLAVIFAQSLGYNGRVVWMYGHTVSEIYHPDKGWLMIDTYGNVMFKRNGEYLSIVDIISDYKNTQPLNIVEANYLKNIDYIVSGYLQNETNVYSKQNLMVILRGGDLLDMRNANRVPSLVFKSILGLNYAIYGIQYVGEERDKVGNFGLGMHKRLFK